MDAVGILHDRLVFSRRTKVLADALAAIIPADTRSILDVGCGDGLIDALLATRRPEIAITGVDVLVRPHPHIKVMQFDGAHLPFADGSFDVVTFVDVLHHTDDPTILLREAKRVARHAVVLKDHTREGFLAYLTLRFMDWVGNARHNVVLPYNYWTRDQWMRGFAAVGLAIKQWQGHVGLYPPPASWVFERNLHFIAALAPEY